MKDEIRRRLDALQRSLPPQQAVLLITEEALSRFGSLSECEAWLEQHRTMRLFGNPREVLADFGKRLRREKPIALLKRIGANLTERAGLLRLWLEANRYLADLAERKLPSLALCAGANSNAMGHLGVRRLAVDLLAEPYPLDPDDAAAVNTALNHQVQSWETVRTDLEQWLGQEPPAEPAPGAEVPEAAVRKLINTGDVKGGAAVELGPIPLEPLLLAPLVDGVWLDRHLVELAEFGAMVEAAGLTLMLSAENHFLAPLRICRRGEDGRLVAADEATVASLRHQARTAVAGFTGRTKAIDDRLYLHVDDYRAWAGRKLPGSLPVVEGVVVPSWNDWVDRQGGPGQTRLAGTAVRHLSPLADHRDFIVCPDPAELSRRRRQRAQRMASLRAIRDEPIAATDFSYGRDLQDLLIDLYAADFAISSISTSYFDGHSIVFNEYRTRLQELTAAARELADSYNRLLELYGCAGPLAERIELRTKEAAKLVAERIVAALVEKVRVESRIAVNADERAQKMINAILKELEVYFR